MRIERQCESCGGTGLYVGMAEHDGGAVVCHTCRGSGKEVLNITVTPFTGRKDRRGITRVFEVNPGIGIGAGVVDGRKFELTDFGGMPLKEWEKGLPFPKGSEMRGYTCPCWWYQSANYKKKPDWKECGWGSFSSCEHFKNKAKCWERWDKENR